MSSRNRFALYLAISIYLVLNQCQFSDAQDPYQLSYGQDVLPQLSQSTSTTKKPGFFKGIKNWFKGDSSSTTASPLQPDSQQSQPNVLSSTKPPNQIPTSSLPTSTGSVRGDSVNSNNRPGNFPQVSSSTAPTPPPRSSTGQVTSQGLTNRDYVNSNIKPSNLPTNPTQGMLSYPAGAAGVVTVRPTVGPLTINPSVRPTSPGTPGAQHLPQSPQQGSLNSNVGHGENPPSSRFPSSTSNLPSHAQSSTGRRDFVNTTPKMQPSGLSPNGQSALTPQDVNPKNPWTNTPQPSSVQLTNSNVSPNHPEQNKEDFPPLPAPGRIPSTTHHPSRPRTPQRQPSANPSAPTGGVSFVPRQPSPGRSTTSKPNELASDDEITTLTEALFTKDVNNQNRYININYQGKTRSSERTDEAPNPLLEVNEQALQSLTIAKMRPLFNNYELDTTVNEHVTPLERKEENDLLDAILATSVMRQAMLFLQEKGLVTPDPRTHRELLKTIWFTLYSRGGGRIGSSAFEHIFLSEVKNGTITGLHNWVYYNDEERQGHIDYKGYIKKLELGNKGAIVKFRFNLNGIEKPVNSMFIGTSPELEMALYTVCFQVRPDKECPVSVSGNRFTIQTYTFRYRGKNLIGSAFPEI